jgi:hypothetical protein
MFAGRRRRTIYEVGAACRGDERICHRRQGIAIGQDEPDDLPVHRLDKIDPDQIAGTGKHIEKCVRNDAGEAAVPEVRTHAQKGIADNWGLCLISSDSKTAL